MKFRIKEIKEDELSAPKFYPQYKSGLFWKNINNTWWANSIFNNNKNDNEYVFSEFRAKKIVNDFKEYLEKNKPYEIVHTL